MAYYKTGTLEHRQYTEHPHNNRTTPEQRNTTGIRNNGTQNTSGTAGTPQNNGGIPEKLEPEDKDCIFHYLQFSLEYKVMRAMNI